MMIVKLENLEDFILHRQHAHKSIVSIIIGVIIFHIIRLFVCSVLVSLGFWYFCDCCLMMMLF